MFNFFKVARGVSQQGSSRDHFVELKGLGWFDLTLPEYQESAEEQLRECIALEFVDTTGLDEGHPLPAHFREVGLGDYVFVSADFRVFGDDPEELAEGGVCKLFKHINETYKLRNKPLFDTCADNFSTDLPSYSVTVDGVMHTIYGPEDSYVHYWGLAVNMIIQIIDSLLEKEGDENRLYHSWSGDNDVRFFLLTEELYEYITTNNIDGGLGPVRKFVEGL